MKNLQKGFATSLVIVVIALLVLGAGAAYFSMQKKQASTADATIKKDITTQPASSDQNNSTISITDIKDVKDFDTCMSYAENQPTVFDIVFTHGSDIGEIRSFGNKFQTAYPRAKLKVSTEQDYLDEALAYNGGSIKTESAMADYKKMISAQASSKISVAVPISDLGSDKSFSNFVSATLKNYTHIKFQQYAGSSPENTLDSSVGMIKYYAQTQCDYKYHTLSASDRAAADIQTADGSIRIGVIGAVVNAAQYYDDHASYASGPLSLNNGICSDTGVYGLKKPMDSIAKIAGASYCYASSKEFAVSAPLKSDPAKGYCTDSTGFSGPVSSPMAASKGYCVLPKIISQDISSCKDKADARTRWICVGDIVDKNLHIYTIVIPFATPISQKVDFCKTFNGVEADYCFSTIIKSESTIGNSEQGLSVCSMVSNQNPWFKNDCPTD